MKDSHTIISQLKNTQAWSKLKEQDEISKLICSLTLEVRKYISFAHKKDQVLLVALKNPNLCAEFNTYTAPMLLGILSSLKEHFPLISSIKQVKAYYPKMGSDTLFKPKTPSMTREEFQAKLAQTKGYHRRRALIREFQQEGRIHFLPPKHYAKYHEIIETFFLQAYSERSDGEFENHSKNQDLFLIFESIRAAIKQSHE
ncbi:hypothetical protein [Helicobacter pametensis]|uniref:hypothetical protein n=1 Tax=Helicobacter pametensis TaxID=95149 RepID=UPI000489D76A|nr:hypothetical protein [Helicobacter pametensis]